MAKYFLTRSEQMPCIYRLFVAFLFFYYPVQYSAINKAMVNIHNHATAHFKS
jgi:hypothetical protein